MLYGTREYDIGGGFHFKFTWPFTIDDGLLSAKFDALVGRLLTKDWLGVCELCVGLGSCTP